MSIGFILGETKDELKLKHGVSVQNHGTGRITFFLTLADEDRLRPLDEVQLVIPGQEKSAIRAAIRVPFGPPTFSLSR